MSKMNLKLGLIFLYLLISVVAKKNEFKGCEDAAFCQRNRGIAAPEVYSLEETSISFKNNVLKGILIKESTSAIFLLELSLLNNGIRLLVDESNCLFSRYRVKDVLIKDPPLIDDVEWDFENLKDTILIKKLSISITIKKSSFYLKVSDQNSDLFEFNSKSQFRIEHCRNKPENVTDSGLWEETFKGFTDSKPRGPQAISLDISFSNFSNVYGIPEHSSDFSLKATRANGEFLSQPYRLYNLDIFEYDLDSPFGLYGSIPFMLAHRADKTVGAFWMNAAEMYIDVEKQEGGSIDTQWISESGIVDLYLFFGPLPEDVLKQYSSITGSSAMPQYFALGYHQCRWNYKDEEDVRNVDKGFDANVLPYDVLWLDIEHTDGKKYMTFDPNSFPNPVAMQEDLASRGHRMVTIVDPHIKRDNDYVIHKAAEKMGYYVKTKDKTDFEGWCWPGSSSYIDVVRSEVREWWSKLFTPKEYKGMTKYLYIWNDMNEPSVFNGPELTMPKDLLHGSGIEHRDVHNLYGFYFHMATAEGLEKRGFELSKNGDRAFVLSRAFFAGSQRLGSVWTGDNVANWNHLKASIPMLLSMSIAGLPFVGADVGGFFNNPTTELLIRWYQLGSFYPFFRAHAHLETARREPWLFGPEATKLIQIALRERYALLPYTYTLFHQSNITGSPVMRPMWYDFPSLTESFALDSQFMFGPSLLVAPVLDKDTNTISVLFPRSTPWYDAWSGKQIVTTAAAGGPSSVVLKYEAGTERIPYFYRGGRIVVRKERPRRNTVAMKNDPVTLVVALDAEGYAEGEYYSDDGSSFAFKAGHFIKCHFTFKDGIFSSRSLKEIHLPKYEENVFIERIVILGLKDGEWEVRELTKANKILEGNIGKIRMQADILDVAFVIRKPDLRLDMDFKVAFSQKKYEYDCHLINIYQYDR